MLRASLILLLTASVALSENWPHLRRTFGIPGLGGFTPEPRTQAELEADGWVQLSSCADGNTMFPGDRWARNLFDSDVVLVFDGNGFIAGVQSAVPVELTADDEYYDFSTIKYYNKGDFFGNEVYYVTAYLVDPSIICNGGRTQEQFDEQGTGDRVIIQTGPTPDTFIDLALNEDELDSELWFEHNCIINMGVHYFSLYYDPDQSCRDVVPLQVLYHNGKLNGFVFQHFADLPGNRWEHPDTNAVNGIVNTAPTCVYDFLETPGFSTMHFYVSDYIIVC